MRRLALHTSHGLFHHRYSSCRTVSAAGGQGDSCKGSRQVNVPGSLSNPVFSDLAMHAVKFLMFLRRTDTRSADVSVSEKPGSWDKVLCTECQKEARYRKATIIDHSIPHRANRKLSWNRLNGQAVRLSQDWAMRGGERLPLMLNRGTHGYKVYEANHRRGEICQ